MSTRRSETRERAAQLHRQQEAAARRRRVTTVTSVVVVGLLVVLGLGVLVLRGGGGTVVDAQAPAGLVDGAIVSGQAAAPVTLTLYEDLQCPGCKAFEAASGDTIDELVASGDVRVETRPLAFLDRQSSTDYSSRALNALACVQDVSPDAVPAYKKTLYEQQPAEGTAGLPDEQLILLANDAGSADVTGCVAARTFKDWVEQTTQADLETITGTPTVLVNGEKLDDTSPDGLRAAVTAASP